MKLLAAQLAQEAERRGYTDALALDYVERGLAWWKGQKEGPKDEDRIEALEALRYAEETIANVCRNVDFAA